MGHSFNNGLHTAAKRGLTNDVVAVTNLTVATGQTCTVDDCKAGLIASVTHTATGVYTFQLSAPYPPKLLHARASLTRANATTVALDCTVRDNSYSATTGQFIVDVSNATPAATDPAATNTMMVALNFARYTT